MSREKAKEILYDNMSENSSKLINKISYLPDWIIDAMIEYHKSQAKNKCECGSEYYHTYKCVNTNCKNCIINKDMKKSNILCDSFEDDCSVTKCECGRGKWEPPKSHKF